MTVKERIEKVAEQAKKASSAVGDKLVEAGKIAKDSAKTIAVAVLDQDGDGVIDQKDVKIITKKAKKEVKKFAKEVKESEMVKDAAAGAAIGAAVAVPVPIIGPVAGAAIGASVGVYANIVKGDTGKNKKTKSAPKKIGSSVKKTAVKGKKIVAKKKVATD